MLQQKLSYYVFSSHFFIFYFFLLFHLSQAYFTIYAVSFRSVVKRNIRIDEETIYNQI